MSPTFDTDPEFKGIKWILKKGLKSEKNYKKHVMENLD
jgi:hypothetical protein